jgi:uncharacterized protein
MKRIFLLPLMAAVALTTACEAHSSSSKSAASTCGKGSTAASANDRPLPKLTGPIVDEADIISDLAERQLSDRLTNLERQTGDQLVVVTTPDLSGEPIEEFGLRLGNGWGIGQREQDNGVLLIVAPNDRKVRIEVGCGLEGLLTDAQAQSIIDKVLLPSLRVADYESAVEEGVAATIKLLLSDVRRPIRRPS